MTTVFGAMLAHADRHGGRLFEPGVGSVDWKPPAHAGMGLGDVVRSGMWQVMLVAPPAVWWRLSAHEDAAMARVRPFLGQGSVYLGTLGVLQELAVSDTDALWRWYFNERLGKPVPEDLETYAALFGFASAGALLRSVLIERWYTRLGRTPGIRPSDADADNEP
ncbi:hypothetical protein [Sorangium sp. So ce381]|uniref:hypothetical protein n=1 Tax=Sorangium sp. So ce381 TaxID=3133307 RepID=UPI003F5B970B